MAFSLATYAYLIVSISLASALALFLSSFDLLTAAYLSLSILVSSSDSVISANSLSWTDFLKARAATTASSIAAFFYLSA